MSRVGITTGVDSIDNNIGPMAGTWKLVPTILQFDYVPHALTLFLDNFSLTMYFYTVW